METFSGRRRPDWQRKPGTKAAVAPRQKQNIKDGAFNKKNTEEENMASHKELRE